MEKPERVRMNRDARRAANLREAAWREGGGPEFLRLADAYSARARAQFELVRGGAGAGDEAPPRCAATRR